MCRSLKLYAQTGLHRSGRREQTRATLLVPSSLKALMFVSRQTASAIRISAPVLGILLALVLWMACCAKSRPIKNMRNFNCLGEGKICDFAPILGASLA